MMMLLTHLTHLKEIVDTFAEHIKRFTCMTAEADTHDDEIDSENNDENMQKKMLQAACFFFKVISHDLHK